MKIAIFRRRYVSYGGGERFVQRFLGALVAAGHEPHLYANGWTSPPPGVQVHRVPEVRAGGAVRVLAYALLAPRAARGAADVVHSFERTFGQDVFRAGEGCHRQWLEVRRPGRGNGRGLPVLRPLHWAILKIEREIARGRAARVLEVNSRMVASDFRRHYGPVTPRVELVRNGVDARRFHPDARRALRTGARAALAVEGERLVLLALGSGFARKGVPTIVRALGRLRRRGVVPLLVVAGKGEADAIGALADGEGVGDAVRVVGEVEDPVPLYAAADLFVLPTLYDPASSATLEALAMGVAVVTTPRNGSAELVEHARSGWILEDPADAATLADVIEAAHDRPRRESLAEAGRRAVEPWTWERHLDETLALYAALA